MLRSTFLIGVTGLWITMMSLLVRREYFEFTPIQSQQEVLLFEYYDYRQEYKAIYLGKEQVGFTSTSLEPLKDPKEGYELRHKTYLSFLFLGRDREMLINGKARLDPRLGLQEFTMKISSGDYWTSMRGQITGGTLNLVMESAESPPLRRLIPVKGPVFYSEALGFVWTPANLKIGKQGKFDVFNPMAMAFQELRFFIREKQKIAFKGQEIETSVAHFDLQGLETRAWISPQGVVLREESPTGLLMEKEDAWKIFDTMRKKRETPTDLPNLFSIPSNLELEKPESLERMKIKLQSANEIKELEIRKTHLSEIPDTPLPVQGKAGEFDAADLASTPWVQADDPAILAKAREIIGGEKSSLKAALKIMDWVHENVTPVPTISLPRAKEVLTLRKGDCNEYTVLFTALARAAGIPARMVAGIVYQNGRFFYHAWPEVFVGRWVGLDPTFGQAPVDVTHIPLASGDLEQQIALVNKIGRIKVKILETQ